MYGHTDITPAPAIAQGVRVARQDRRATIASQANISKPAAKVTYTAVCQVCNTEKNLTTFRRAGGDVVLCLKHGGLV